ncbi:MAG: hypothetical protein Q8P04_01035 [bacterium]|nr:hypothetical protein [bacterium]
MGILDIFRSKTNTSVDGTHDAFITTKERFTKKKDALRVKFGGKEPSDNDVEWGVLNDQLMEYAESGDWDLYRNVRFNMAEVLRKEAKLKDALKVYLEVCYLDLNGPGNIKVLGGPAFQAKLSTGVDHQVVILIEKIMKKLNLSKDDVGKIFIEHNSRIGKNLQLSLTPEECWSSLEKEFGKGAIIPL